MEFQIKKVLKILILDLSPSPFTIYMDLDNIFSSVKSKSVGLNAKKMIGDHTSVLSLISNDFTIYMNIIILLITRDSVSPSVFK